MKGDYWSYVSQADYYACVHPYVYENKRSKSMKLFAQILVKFT